MMVEERELGVLLSQAREALSLSQEDAAEQAGVPLLYLKALERGEARQELVPDESYLIPYLRRYADILHLDQSHVIPLLLSEAHKPRVRRPPELVSRARSRRKLLWIGATLITGAAAMIFFLAWWRAERPPKNPPPVGSRPAAMKSPGFPAALDPTQLGSTRANPPAPRTAQTLKMIAKEQSWITLRIDGGDQETVILHPGEERTWQARDHFLLTVGNAGGLRMVFNGVEQPSLGQPGEVVRDLRLPAAAD